MIIETNQHRVAGSTSSAQKLLEVFVRFRRLHTWQNSYAITSVSGLTPREMILMSYVKEGMGVDGQGVTVSELSNNLNVASPTITQQINNLETHGYVERSIDKDDRRVVRIRLTEKGLQAQQKASAAFLATVNGLVEYLGEEDSERLAELMTKVFQYFTEVRNEK
jgi:DNA-binding MarR family transcriptional regulator